MVSFFLLMLKIPLDSGLLKFLSFSKVQLRFRRFRRFRLIRRRTKKQKNRETKLLYYIRQNRPRGSDNEGQGLAPSASPRRLPYLALATRSASASGARASEIGFALFKPFQAISSHRRGGKVLEPSTQQNHTDEPCHEDLSRKFTFDQF